MDAIARKIRERMEVVGSRGDHLGTVDHLEGDEIELARGDLASGMIDHIPMMLVASVDTKVHLCKTLDEVRAMMHSG